MILSTSIILTFECELPVFGLLLEWCLIRVVSNVSALGFYAASEQLSTKAHETSRRNGFCVGSCDFVVQSAWANSQTVRQLVLILSKRQVRRLFLRILNPLASIYNVNVHECRHLHSHSLLPFAMFVLRLRDRNVRKRNRRAIRRRAVL